MEVRVRGARRRSLDDLPDDKGNSRLSSTFPRNSKAKSVLFGYDVNNVGSKEDIKIESPKKTVNVSTIPPPQNLSYFFYAVKDH